MKKIISLQTVILSLLLFSNLFAQNSTFNVNNTKMNQVLRSINEMYVDTVNFDHLVEIGVMEMLKELDPHSVYIPVKEVQAANEPLQGAFDGIGVTFQIIKDTINVMEVLVGGPSEKVGLQAGDKIIKVDTSNATGKGISNRWVQEHLRGPKGTKVTILVKRGKKSEPLEFTITRDKIPMNSINVYFMVDDKTGYVRLERFAQTSPDEFITAMTKLKARGLENLILDLRGNGGGYLEVAFRISDQFLNPGQLIVYTNNRNNERQEFVSTGNGCFSKGKLIVLVDENSASASEIVSGAVQDWDRGLVIGRRSFGKGLVQSQMNLLDNSLLRLTTAKYYTPSGRYIQKPYDEGKEAYNRDLDERYEHGELLNADSIVFADSLKYFTKGGRVVYGGGGIMPDIFIPMDTSKVSPFYNKLFRRGIYNSFISKYLETHRKQLKEQYPTYTDFQKKYQIDTLYANFIEYAKEEGVENKPDIYFSNRLTDYIEKNKTKLDSVYNQMESLSSPYFATDFMDHLNRELAQLNDPALQENTAKHIKKQLRFALARSLYSFADAYKIWLEDDKALKTARELITDEKNFKKYRVSSK